MTPARGPRAPRGAIRLLVIDPRGGALTDTHVSELPQLLAPGDVLVVNDAATFPASLHTCDGEVELRLLGPWRGDSWRAVALGRGDWRTPTEARPPPPALRAGDRLELGRELNAEVVAVSELSPRLLEIRFDREGAALWEALYARSKPVQYSYLSGDLDLWSVQTVYGGRPWAAEMPSAGRSLTWNVLLALRRRGVALARITHAAGLSSTGDPAIDAALPLPEKYDIPAATIAAIVAARAAGGRVIAVGTTVVRALEGCAAAHGGSLRAGEGETDLILDAAFSPRVVDGVLTGMHDPTESHFHVLRAFAPEHTLRDGTRHATDRGYLCHEFGDATLILDRAPRAA